MSNRIAGRACVTALLAMAVGAPALAAQPRPVQTRTFDSIASANLTRDRTIGAVVGIVKGADTLFLAPYGEANVESDVPMHMDAIFAIGSITRQLGAAARPLPWVEGLTVRQGGVLPAFRGANGSSGPVTELRYDTGTEHAILARS